MRVPQKRKSLQATRQEAEARFQRHKQAREALEREAEHAERRAADVAMQIQVGRPRRHKHLSQANAYAARSVVQCTDTLSQRHLYSLSTPA